MPKKIQSLNIWEGIVKKKKQTQTRNPKDMGMCQAGDIKKYNELQSIF